MTIPMILMLCACHPSLNDSHVLAVPHSRLHSHSSTNVETVILRNERFVTIFGFYNSLSVADSTI